MQSIFLLTVAELVKNRKQMLSQMIIIFIASMLLSLGLLMAINFNNYFMDLSKSLNAAHVAFAFREQRYEESYLRYFQNREDITATQTDELYLSGVATLKMPLTDLTTSLYYFNYDNMGIMNQIRFVDTRLKPDSTSVYVPYQLKINGGLNLGSTIGIGLNEDPNDPTKEVVYQFTVAGFTEDVYFGTGNMGGLGFYFPQDVYKRFTGELSADDKSVMISAQTSNPAESFRFIDEFINEAQDGEDTSSFSASVDLAQFARTAMSGIFASIVVVFAVIIQLVSQIVIRFRIGDSIEVGMRNYGALKALGYTSTQIVISIVLQFVLTTVLICIGGIAASYPAAGFMSGLLASLTGLNWIPGFDPVISCASFGFIISITVLTAFLTSRRIKKTPPIEALRGGSTLGSIRYNILPFEKSNLSLTTTLAAKTMFLNIKQNLMIVLILASVSAAVVFSVVMSDNVPKDSFLNSIAGQMPDVYIAVAGNADTNEIRDEISRMDGVKKAAIYANSAGTAVFAGQTISLSTMPDFAEVLNADEVYRGRFPVHPHEIVLNGLLAEQEGKHIGDTITMSVPDKTEEYIITGFNQNGNGLGRNAFLTTEGYRLLDPYYKESLIAVVLPKEMDVAAFIDELKERYDDKLTDVTNYRLAMEVQMTSILGMIYSLCLAIEVITVLVVIFLLFLVVRTLVLRRRQEIGIQKALGFTTFQLMNQIAGSFVPIAVVGTTLGCIAGSLMMDSVMGLMMKVAGVMQMKAVIPIPQVVIAGVLLCLLTYVVSLLVSIRIRKISAYALFTE